MRIDSIEITKYRNKFTTAVISFAFFITSTNSTYGMSLDSVAHIHHLQVVRDNVLLATHEGLYKLMTKNKINKLGSENLDVMGITAIGNSIYASGHPGIDSKFRQPIGLIRSNDFGKNWQSISLQGEVDFHFLTGARRELYGIDSGTGNLLHSSNLGRSWKSLGVNKYSDIAVSPTLKANAIAISDGQLISTSNAFRSTSTIKNENLFTQIEWNEYGIFALSNNKLHKSDNSGKTWTEQFVFKSKLSVLSASKELIVVVAGQNFYLSKDGAKTFKVLP